MKGLKLALLCIAPLLLTSCGESKTTETLGKEDRLEVRYSNVCDSYYYTTGSTIEKITYTYWTDAIDVKVYNSGGLKNYTYQYRGTICYLIAKIS